MGIIKNKLKNLFSKFKEKSQKEITTEKKEEKKTKEGKKFISYEKIATALLDSLEENIDEVGTELIVPHHFVIYLHPLNIKRRKAYEDVVIRELKKELSVEAKKNSYYLNEEKVSIEFLPDETLSIHEVRVISPGIPEETLESPKGTKLEEGSENTVLKPKKEQEKEEKENGKNNKT